MAHSVTYDEIDRLVAICYRGKLGLSEVREGAAEAARTAKKHACSRILIDSREVELALSTLEIYELPATLSKVVAEFQLDIHTLKRAVVVSRITDDVRFLENVAVNRGNVAKVFLDMDAARAWLTGS